MKIKTVFLIFTSVLLMVSSCGNGTDKKGGREKIHVIPHAQEMRVDVLVDGKPFTSFLYTDTLAALTKPVLWPVISAAGDTLTRGFPLHPVAGERTDHPHHIGMWLTYGDVNHIDFWGNSPAMPPEMHDKLGWIRNVKILKTESGKDKGILEFTADWLDAFGKVMLKEHTTFTFSDGNNTRIIDRVTTLTAQKDTIVFYDTKEGMMAIRVTHALELPTNKPITLSDAHGNKTVVEGSHDTIANGNYLTSTGVTGLEAWGKRADWVCLHGKVKGTEESITIFDHPDNPGHPSYWHARGYGLFSVNPLGQKTFSKGKEVLNLTLAPGQSVTFRYRVMIKSGKVTAGELNKDYEEYIK